MLSKGIGPQQQKGITMKRSLFLASGLIGALFASALIASPAIAKSNSKTTTVTNSQSVDNYNGFHSYSGAEHGGSVSTKTSGNAAGLGVSNNAAVANSGAVGGGAVISGNLGSTGAGIAGSAHLGYAQTGAASGSSAVAGSAGNGSSRVETGGYAAGGAGVRNEWGTTTTNTVSSNTTKTKN